MSAPIIAYPIELPPWTIYRTNAVEYPIYDHNADGTAFDCTTFGDTFTSVIKRVRGAAGLVVATVTVDATRASGSGGPGVPQLNLTLVGVDTLTLSRRDPNTRNEPDYYCDVLATGGARDPLTPYWIPVYFDENVTDPA